MIFKFFRTTCVAKTRRAKVSELNWLAAQEIYRKQSCLSMKLRRNSKTSWLRFHLE